MLVSSSLLLLASLSSLASAAHSPSTPRRRHHSQARVLAQRDAAPWVCSTITRVGSDQGGLKWIGCEGELPLEEVAVTSSSSVSSFVAEPTTSSTYEEPAPTTTTQEVAPPVQTTQAAAEENFQQEAQTTSSTEYEAEAQPSSSSTLPAEPTTTFDDQPTPIPTTTSSPLADSQNEPETQPIFVNIETETSSPEPTTTSSPPPSETTTTSTSSPDPTPTPEPTTTTFVEPAAAAVETVAPIVNAVASSSSTSSDDQSRYLAAHNSFRALYGASALSWSEDAASAAKTWAGRCVFEHSGGTLGSFGENLAAGTGSGYTIESAIKSWTDEAKDYNPSAPNFSHFTQVVWKGTTQVGCAEVDCDGIFDASFGKAKYHVCEYSAPGNVAGQFGTNVGSLA